VLILTTNTSINMYSFPTINTANLFTGQDTLGSHKIEADVVCI